MPAGGPMTGFGIFEMYGRLNPSLCQGTLDPKPYTLYPINPKPYTLYLIPYKSSTLNPIPYTLNPKPYKS